MEIEATSGHFLPPLATFGLFFFRAQPDPPGQNFWYARMNYRECQECTEGNVKNALQGTFSGQRFLLRQTEWLGNVENTKVPMVMNCHENSASYAACEPKCGGNDPFGRLAQLYLAWVSNLGGGEVMKSFF